MTRWKELSPESRRILLLIAFCVLIGVGVYVAGRIENSHQDRRAGGIEHNVVRIQEASPCTTHPRGLKCFVAHAAATRQTTAAQACFILSTVTTPQALGRDFPVCESPKIRRQIAREGRLVGENSNAGKAKKQRHLKKSAANEAAGGGDATSTPESSGHSQPGPSQGPAGQQGSSGDGAPVVEAPKSEPPAQESLPPAAAPPAEEAQPAPAAGVHAEVPPVPAEACVEVPGLLAAGVNCP